MARMNLIVPAALGLAVSCVAVAAAHDGVVHFSEEEAARHEAQGGEAFEVFDAATDAPGAESGAGIPDGPALPFPVQIEARFDLIDHNGTPRTQESFPGKTLMVFFGYANCDSICSVALPRMAQALDLMGATAANVQAVMITVDPANDTVAAMQDKMPTFHPDLLGLTGDAAALQAAYDAFQVEVKQVTTLPDGQPVYAHGSFVYLIGADGTLLTVLPPILSSERIAELVEHYL